MSPNVLAFVVPGAPRGKERPRFSDGGVYTPRATRDYQEQVAWLAHRARGPAKPWGGPVLVEIDAVHVIPKSWTKAEREAAGHAAPVRAPDLDNVAKAVLDACNGVLWDDDRQVASLLVRRVWGERNEVRVRAAAMETNE